MSALKVSALAATLALSSATGLAEASAYAVSYNEIDNFSLVFGNGGAGSLSGFTFSTDVAAQGNSSDAHYGTKDAAAACVGAFCGSFSNQFYSHGTGADYAYGDALIGSDTILSGIGSASSIGEISAGPAGFASGSNTMMATLSVTTPGTVSFSFDAQPYMQVLGAGGASSSMTVTISGVSGQVFNWAPSGLNLAITSGVTYNPGTSSFAATTSNLAAGAYTLNITMSNQVTAVPEPETWAMLLVGMGLVGLRARQKSRARDSALA